ncbi:MAG: putative quinol monooxygenase [Gemmatimonadaceae bacterium]
MLSSTSVLRSEWCRDPESPGRYVIHGEFESMQHFREYRRSHVVARIGGELLPLLKGTPEFQHYEARVFEQS